MIPNTNVWTQNAQLMKKEMEKCASVECRAHDVEKWIDQHWISSHDSFVLFLCFSSIIKSIYQLYSIICTRWDVMNKILFGATWRERQNNIETEYKCTHTQTRRRADAQTYSHMEYTTRWLFFPRYSHMVNGWLYERLIWPITHYIFETNIASHLVEIWDERRYSIES